jgi:hypothetical protein
MAIVLVFFFWPAAQALRQRVMMEDAFGSTTQFVGLENFQRLFADDTYLASFRTTAIFSVLVAGLGIGIALLLAVMADSVVKGATVYRTLLVWPYAVAPARSCAESSPAGWACVDRRSSMTVVTTEIRGPIAILRLNRPDAMNALGADGDGEAVRAACDALNADLSIRCVILTGEGRAFSAGGDIKKMADPEGPFSGGGLPIRSHYQRNIHRIARALFSLDMPVIAAVNGPAIGAGCDLACMCDIRIASESARFAESFVKLGIIPGD